MARKIFILPDEAGTERLGAALGAVCLPGTTVFLTGDLGAGKTTLTRGFLRGRGYAGIVKSPTYTLVEEYRAGDLRVYHFDLYRVNDPEELETMGIRDYFTENSVRLVEWPSRGEGILPGPDVAVRIDFAGAGRRAAVAGETARGNAAVARLALPENPQIS